MKQYLTINYQHMKKIYFLITLLCTFFFTTSVLSQTKRYVKAIASGSGNGSSWSNASSDLQAMIDLSAPNDQVWVAKGTYKPTKNSGYTATHTPLSDPRFKSFVLSNGVKLYGGFSGSESVMGQRNPVNKTILSGDFLGNDVGLTNNSENAYHVLFATNLNTAITLDGFTITGGNTSGMPQAYNNNPPWYTEITTDGGGIFASDASILALNCFFVNNNAAHYGGAIYGANGVSDYSNCLFINNHAQDGAVSYVTALGNSLYSHFTNCTMFNNSSNGSVCKTSVDDNTYIVNCIIWGNTVTGLSAGSYYVNYSDVQNAFASGTHAGVGTVEADPAFTNAADPDGADNIFGTADDGLIPQCGPAIGGGSNTGITFIKDYKNGTRILNGTIDMGIYETSLIQPVTSLQIYSLSNHSTSENLPAGLCQGKAAVFGMQATGGNGGSFQWKQNGVNVGTNSTQLSITSFNPGDQIKLTLNSPAGCAPASIVESNVITLQNVSSGKPVFPTNITGPTNSCPYMNGPAVEYKINKAPGTVKYHWYVGFPSQGVSIVSHPNGGGINDTTVMVAFDDSWEMDRV